MIWDVRSIFIHSWFTGVTLLACLQLSAQSMALTDTLRVAFEYDPVPLGRIETRNSFVDGRHTQVRGVQGGIRFGPHVSMGCGFHWMRDDIDRFKLDSNVSEGRLSLNYIAPFFEYHFIHQNHWLVSIPLRIGLGTARILDGPLQTDPGFIWMYEPAMTVEYQFLKYFGIGGGLGYRLMFIGNRDIGLNFNAPLYLFKFRIRFGDIYRDINENP